MCLFFRILVQICKTRAFQKLNPAQFELHDEVKDAIQVSNNTIDAVTNSLYIAVSIKLMMGLFYQSGTQEWFTIKKGLHQPMTKVRTSTPSDFFTRCLNWGWYAFSIFTTVLKSCYFFHHAAMQDLSEIVGALSRLIGEVQEDIKHNKDVWNRVFVR